MANAGFNAAKDVFSMGEAWKVRSSDLNASGSTAECKDSLGDVTHRDAYGARISPSAEYTLASDVTSLPALGSVVEVDGKKVMVTSVSVNTAAGQAPTATVSGVEVESGATTRRTYGCGALAISARHKAQDILGWLGGSAPSTLTSSTFTFTVEATVADPQGTIIASDCGGGKVVASYTFASGTGDAPVPPSIEGTTRVVGDPVSKSSPENDYTTFTFSMSDSLTGAEASS